MNKKVFTYYYLYHCCYYYYTTVTKTTNTATGMDHDLNESKL